jgi:hypothetical protein
VQNCLESLEHRRKYNIPRTVFSDRADINSKRFLGIYKDEKQTRGKQNSMLRVVWQFCKTRVIFSTVFYSISIFFELLAPVVFLTLTLDILEEEILKVNGTKLINVNETSNEVTFLIQFFQINKNNLNFPDSSNRPYKNVQTL